MIPETYLQDPEFCDKPKATIEVEGRLYPPNEKVDAYISCLQSWGCQVQNRKGEVVRFATLGQQDVELDPVCKELRGE